MGPSKDERYLFKCKPTYNFQSVEFEYVGDKDDIPEMMDLYNEVLKHLMAIAPEQPAKVSQGPIKAPKITKPSEKQYDIMDRFHIPYDDTTTAEEASKLITESIERSKGN